MRALKKRYGRAGTKTKARSTGALMVLEGILTSRYGCNPLTCDATTVEWAADHMIGRDTKYGGVGDVARAWKRLNAQRERLGVRTTNPSYGTPLYKAYYAKKS